MAKEKILAQVATLLEKFSERLVRVASETRQNTDAVATLRDDTRLKIGKLQQSTEYGIEAVAQRQWALHTDRITKIEKTAQDTKLTVSAIYKELQGLVESQLGSVKVQEQNLDAVEENLRKEADEREERQTARDQNNVQALVNLRDSTAKAFSQVRDDVAALIKQIQRLNERVGQVESTVKIIDTGLSLERSSVSAIDQQIVDSKLKGARSYVDTLEKRISELEEALRPSVFYLGHEVNYRKNILAINGQEFFPFQHDVVSLSVEPFGVIVGLSNQDEYILCGGPSPATMVVTAYQLNCKVQSNKSLTGWQHTEPLKESGQHLDKSDPRVNP